MKNLNCKSCNKICNAIDKSTFFKCGKCFICHVCSKKLRGTIGYDGIRIRGCHCCVCRYCKGVHKQLSCGCRCKVLCRCQKRLGYHTAVFEKSPKINFKELYLQRAVGLELEIGDITSRYREYLIQLPGQWHRDASVQPSELEYVTLPLSGDALLKFVTNFMAYMRTYNGSVNTTCGLHVHVDVRDYDYSDIARLIVVWSKIEPEIYKLCKPLRLINEYCWPLFTSVCIENRDPWISKPMVTYLNKPWIPTQTLKAKVVEAVYHKKITWPSNKHDTAMQGLQYIQKLYKSKYLNDIMHTTDDDSISRFCNPRYAGLNLHSYFYRNTIEFRMREGVLDFDEIVSWAVLCGSIIELVKNLSYNQVQDIHCLMDLLNQETKTYRVQSNILNYFKEKLA